MDDFICATDKTINNISTRTNELEKSQSFISEEFEKNKENVKKLEKMNDLFQKDLSQFRKQIEILEKKLEKESLNRISLAQYGRRNMVEVSGIPRNEGENAKQLIAKMANLAKFDYFDPQQIDVAHRTSTKDDAPIIVLFHCRTEREVFFSQRSKLQNLHVRQFERDEEELKYATEVEQKKRDHATKIYLNESLTPENQKLLFDVRTAIKDLKSNKGILYKYVWTYHGEIRVRKNEQSNLLKINCGSDINKIK